MLWKMFHGTNVKFRLMFFKISLDHMINRVIDTGLC